MANQRRDPDQRPSPDALLETARREQSGAGRLKIFLGAAPGVGKTYEMLQSAHARLRAGVDVVVGVVETHGRAETEALLDGLEIRPRKRLDYKDQVLEEMDLDALIATARSSRWSTNSPIPMRRAAAIQNATSTSRSCCRTASTSTPRSTSSTSKASTTWWRRSPISGCAKPCRIRCSTAPTASN
jgi:hypothetical protein